MFEWTPKQIHTLPRCSQPCPRPARPHDKHQQLWYKNFVWWWMVVFSKRGEEEGNVGGADNNMRNPILFSLKAECKLERTGCIKSPFLQNSDTELLCLLENFQICCATQTCCPPPTAGQALVLIGGEPSVTFDLPDRCRSHHSWWSAWLAWQVSHNVLLNGGSTKPHLGTAGLSPHSHTHTHRTNTHV